jgi:hypothetical protein
VRALIADARRDWRWAAALATLLLTLVVFVDVLDDPDLWWHLRAGRWILDNRQLPCCELFSFTAAGAPWTLHEWGFEVVTALARPLIGLGGLTLLISTAAWSGLVALLMRLRGRGVPPLVALAAVLLAAKVAEPVLGTRPAALSFALMSWMLLLCERQLARGGRAWLLLPGLMLVWANLHGAFVAGLAVLGLVSVVSLALARDPVSRRRAASLAAATVLAAAAACINPAGPAIYAYTVSVAGFVSHLPIQEWAHPNLLDPGMLPLTLLLVSTVALLLRARRAPVLDVALAAAGMAAALLAVRNVAFCAALAVPLWAQLVGNHQASGAGARQHRPRAGMLAALGALAVMGPVGAELRAAGDSSAGAVAARYPACAAAALASTGAQNLYAPYFHSGFLIDRGWPAVRVFEYGEVASLGSTVFYDSTAIAAGGAGAPALLRHYGATAALTPPGALRDRLLDAGWQSRGHDGGLELLVTGAGSQVPQLRC